MRLSKKINNYIRHIVKEESEENVQKLNEAIKEQEAIAENVRKLNETVAAYEVVAENVRSLNGTVAAYEVVAENVRSLNETVAAYEVVAENVRSLNETVAAYEVVAENVRSLNETVAAYEVVAENVRGLNETVAAYEVVAENVRSLNETVAAYEVVAENVRGLNEMVAENVRSLNNSLQNYGVINNNIENINSTMEMLRSTMEMQKVKLTILEKDARHSNMVVPEPSIDNAAHEYLASRENIYSGIDYFDFENYFRGSMELIKRNQRQYVSYYQGKKNVLDLGCGRGEFLELLKENDIEARGVDLYEEFAEMCKMHGLDVICDDALHFLSTQQKVGGIFAGQLIEHLTVNQLVELCRLAYEKLEKGAYIIMETPNPTCLAIYSHAFYIDPSHNKPVHPLTVKYILEKSGFTEIEIIYTDTSKLSVQIPLIEGIQNADKFNAVMSMVSDALFGSQDYAIIAKK